MNILEEYESNQLKPVVPEFEVGDTVDVHVRIVEGDKQRVQIFNGTVIARKSARNRSAFTVRRIVAGEGVERVFPLHSPWVEKVVVKRRGRVRRAKLYYLRERVGKSTKVRERIGLERRTRKGDAGDDVDADGSQVGSAGGDTAEGAAAGAVARSAES
jgi:large subunit ribosomal protein L19